MNDHPMPDPHNDPDYELSLKTIAMPADTNANGDIFGGWLLSQMDLAGATHAIHYTKGRVVTIGIEAMSFHEPVFVGDGLILYTKITKVGRTSVTVHIESWARRSRQGDVTKVTEGLFTFIAMDDDRHSVSIEERRG